MTIQTRDIVHIDEEKCNGCGICIPSCAEGALQIIDGKARLVSDALCDGLGACLGECPQGAISVEKRPAEGFDHEAVEQMVKKNQSEHQPAACPGGGCPGAAARNVDRAQARPESGIGEAPLNWPVQMELLHPAAPYLQKSRLVLAADCTGFSSPGFHDILAGGKVLIIGCPKLDDTSAYLEKLTEILRRNEVLSIDVVIMEVPCCSGLWRLVNEAVSASGKDIPVTLTRRTIGG